MGWIFFKSRYERLKTIESGDLEKDPGPWAVHSSENAYANSVSDAVVRFQHTYYSQQAFFTRSPVGS